MKMFTIILIVIVCSCNNANQNKVTADTAVAQKDSIETVKDTINSTEINDSVIHINFAKDSIRTTVSGKMNGINHPVTVYIPIKQGRELTVSISTEDSLANIRINQIFTPNGNADGPFGKELKRKINQQGMYKIILAENMMQGDEWKGGFKLTVKVE